MTTHYSLITPPFAMTTLTLTKPVRRLRTLSRSLDFCQNPSLHKSFISFSSLYIFPTSLSLVRTFTTYMLHLPIPTIICGNFSAHSTPWGGNQRNNQGNAVDFFIFNEPDLLRLNNFRIPKHFSLVHNSFSQSFYHFALHLSGPI